MFFYETQPIEAVADLLERYGHFYPRRTKIKTFSEVEARKVALSNLTVGYDQEGGFLGYQVKAEAEHSFACSEYDKLLLIYKDGLYKVINVADKLFVGHDIMWAGRVEDNITFNILYRDGKENLCYIKRFNTPKFILEKEYRLFSEHKRSQILFLKIGENIRVRVHFRPSKRAKHNYGDYSFDDFLIKGAGAIGKRVSTRTVRRIVEQADKNPAKDLDDNPQPTLVPKADETK